MALISRLPDFFVRLDVQRPPLVAKRGAGACSQV